MYTSKHSDFGQQKAPKVLISGQFVYKFVYIFRKSLNIKVYCGETGSMHAHDSLHSSLRNGSVFITVTVGILLFYIVAPVYTIVLLVMLCQDSQPFCNRYGPSPKYIEQEEMRQ